MSACGKTSSLEALVRGELPVVHDFELRAHAQACPRCRHELSWLETEAALFRERASRDEVRHLWADVEKRSGLAPSRRPWRALSGLAAALLLVAVASRLVPSLQLQAGASDASVPVAWETFVSEPLETAGSAPQSTEPPCSRLPEGLGFHCDARVPASFIATR